MAFPGTYTFKRSLPIPETSIAGPLNFDGVFCITEACFPDTPALGDANPINMITLGNARAWQQGGTDFAVSADEFGATRLAVDIVRFELSATPANSRVEVWVRRPNVSDTVATLIKLWGGDATATQPAVTANYGRNDVWNGTTGGGTPIVSWAVLHLGELSSDPDPCFKDSSGNNRHASYNGTVTRVDMLPGRGQSGEEEIARISAAWAPGTADYAVITVTSVPTGGTVHYVQDSAEPNWAFGSDQSVVFSPVGGATPNMRVNASGSNTYTLMVAAVSKTGTTANLTNNIANSTITGLTGSYSFASPRVLAPAWWNPATFTVSLSARLSCAPNAYWTRALVDNIQAPSTFWDTSYGIENSAVPTDVTVRCVDAGTLARIQNARVFVEASTGGELTAGADLANGLTNASGELLFTISIGANQDIIGRTRKASASPLYKSGLVAATISPAVDVTLTVPMVRDE